MAAMEKRCYVCGGRGDYWHDECWEGWRRKKESRQIGQVAERIGKLIQMAQDALEDIIARNLPRGAQYRISVAILAGALQKIEEETIALQGMES